MNAKGNNRRSAAIVGLLTALWLSPTVGCQRYHDYSAFIREPRPIASAEAYRLAPPDQIQLYSKRVRELSGHTEVIRPDGRLTLPLLGPVYVAGKTIEQVQAELEQMAATYYEDADVTLKVTRYASKKIFVFGEVSIPGPYAYDGGNTVLRTLAVAQPTRLADPSRIQVLRPNRDGQLIRRMTVDLDKMVKEGDTLLDAALEEGDIVYVPPTGLAAVGLVFQQLLLPLQPAASTFRAPVDMSTSFDSEVYGSNR